jgi:hypothetical protein
MNDHQRLEIKGIVTSSLNEAERVWGQHGKKLVRKAFALDEAYSRADSAPSKIPGHGTVADQDEKVDTFIALVADLRDSSQHLLMAISGTNGGVSELQRVYYETSALLPALEKTIQYFDGSVTEYLGDGVLAFFKVEDGEETESVRTAYRAAYNCIDETRVIVNNELQTRYRSPPLALGVGLGMSRAIVSLVGLPAGKHPKAIGRCVYYAAKLSFGRNEVHVDDEMKRHWPSGKGGKVSFLATKHNNVSGFRVHKG